MTNDKDIVNMLESVWTCNNVWECCGDKTEYELIQEAIKEIKRLRLRPEEWEAIDSAKKVLVYYGANNCAVGLLNIVDRLGGGE